MVSNLTGMVGLAAIVLVATALSFLAKKTKQPTIVAYIVAGIILGSVGLNLVSPGKSVSLISELGLAFLLFLIGMEIRVDEIREIIEPTAIIAVLQMSLVGAVAFLTSQALGFNFIESIFIAGAAVYSSTAVVVKLLSDKDEISTLPGKLDVGILLIQDVAVILLLAIIGTGAGKPLQIAVNLAEVGLMVLTIATLSYFSSRYLLPQLFEKIAENRHTFFIYGLAWAFLMITIAEGLGISMEIGAFFAGLSIAQLPYSQELQERVRPLTDFFMAVFFINVGLNLVPGAFTLYWKEAIIASVVFMAAKFVSIFLLTDRMKFTPETSFKTSLNMSQISEFALIMGAIASSPPQNIVGDGIMGFLSIVAITTMGASSYLITYNHQIYTRLEHLLERLESEEKKDVEVRTLEDHALVVGYDTLAKRTVSVLDNYFEDVVIVDRNPDNTEELANSDYEYIYGDFKHGEIRNASGVKEADFVISFSPERWVNRKISEETDEEATVFVKAGSLEEAADLYERGVHYVIVQNILAADKLQEYVKLYLEDRELFDEEVKTDIQSIRWGGRS